MGCTDDGDRPVRRPVREDRDRGDQQVDLVLPRPDPRHVPAGDAWPLDPAGRCERRRGLRGRRQPRALARLSERVLALVECDRRAGDGRCRPVAEPGPARCGREAGIAPRRRAACRTPRDVDPRVVFPRHARVLPAAAEIVLTDQSKRVHPEAVMSSAPRTSVVAVFCLLVSAAARATQADFELTATRADFDTYFPTYLANGYFSAQSSLRGTEATPAQIVALMDYTPGDVSRPAAVPGWTEIDYFDGAHWL